MVGIRPVEALKERALLRLPHGASTQDLRNSETFRDVAFNQAQNWHSFVRDDLQRIVGNSDLYLVTGVTKSKSWSIGTVDNSSDEQLGDVDVESASTIISGPYHRPGEELWENQTVFMRGFKIAVRSPSSGPLSTLGCGILEDFVQSVSRRISGYQLQLTSFKNYHPSDIINQHILDSVSWAYSLNC